VDTGFFSPRKLPDGIIVKLKCSESTSLLCCRGRLESYQDEKSGIAQMVSVSA